MSCPFLREQPVAEGARIIRRAFQINRVLRDRQDPLAQPESVIVERYCFSREGVIYIMNLLEPHIKCSTQRSRALTTAQTVCIALRFFASGTFLYTIGDAENLVKSAVCRAIRKVYLALKQFLGVFVVFPSHLRPQVVKQNFFAIAGFPNVIGAIDCTHIPIKAPPGPNEGDFVNRKGVHSVNVQMVCDSMFHITNVEAKWPGSVHDSRIFRESHLCTLFERGDFDGILLGDRGYACRQYFMTPFPDPNPGPQNRYNAALARTRARIEMTFGQLKERFQCLKSLRVAPDRACDIIVACAILHNIATIRKERIPVVGVQPDDDLQPVHLDQPSGRAARDRIVEHHF
uniref:Putative nuclease HARBI1 n=1 Tax=Cyprinus carpio TaxID=7962 RepID=A0A8C1P7X1_CYPCA